MGLDNVNKTCVAGFMLVSSALGGCASGMQETPYTGTIHPMIKQSKAHIERFHTRIKC